MLIKGLFAFSQVIHIPIGKKSTGSDEVTLELINRYQYYNGNTKNDNDSFDSAINSPKSVNYSIDGKKFYVQSLEGYTTAVYDAKTKKKIKTIKHVFDKNNQDLFKNSETTAFGYEFLVNL